MPKIMAQYPKIERLGSVGSVILGILEVQVCLRFRYVYSAGLAARTSGRPAAGRIPGPPHSCEGLEPRVPITGSVKGGVGFRERLLYKEDVKFNLEAHRTWQLLI